MPAAVPIAVAGVGAVAGIANAKIQSNAAKRAAQAQERSTADALSYQKSRDAIADQRYDRKWQAYQDAVADYRSRHGGGPAPAKATSGGVAMPVSLADLVGATQDTTDAGAASGGAGSVADMIQGGWNDWRRYGA